MRICAVKKQGAKQLPYLTLINNRSTTHTIKQRSAALLNTYLSLPCISALRISTATIMKTTLLCSLISMLFIASAAFVLEQNVLQRRVRKAQLNLKRTGKSSCMLISVRLLSPDCPLTSPDSLFCSIQADLIQENNAQACSYS